MGALLSAAQVAQNKKKSAFIPTVGSVRRIFHTVTDPEAATLGHCQVASAISVQVRNGHADPLSYSKTYLLLGVRKDSLVNENTFRSLALTLGEAKFKMPQDPRNKNFQLGGSHKASRTRISAVAPVEVVQTGAAGKIRSGSLALSLGFFTQLDPPPRHEFFPTRERLRVSGSPESLCAEEGTCWYVHAVRKGDGSSNLAVEVDCDRSHLVSYTLPL